MNFPSISISISSIIYQDVGRIENEQIRKSYGLNLISQMAFDVRYEPVSTVDTSYNAKALHQLQAWTANRSDIATLDNSNTDIATSTDIEIHDDEDVIDYIEEENEDSVGYFTDWNKK